MRELLHSHEEDLITRVVSGLRSEEKTNYNANQAHPLPCAVPGVDNTPIDPTLLKIQELEEQIRKLRSGHDPPDPAPPRLPELDAGLVQPIANWAKRAGQHWGEERRV